MPINAGYFSGTKYDKCAYEDELQDSVAPFTYTMNTDKIYNCNGCLTQYSPQGGYLGAGTSSISKNRIAAAQQNIDVDSVMSNRNMLLSRCKRAQVNTEDFKKFKLNHYQTCSDSLDTRHSRLTDNAMFYRGVAINRFYDLNRDPQANVFYDWAINTSIEARDNYIPNMPNPLN
jgi:hypothetical protein